MRRHADRGFTLAELLVAIAIVGIISGIAVPIYISSLTSARNGAIEGSLSVVATAIETRVTAWNGRPPYAFGVCNDAATYPTNPGPTNTCPVDQWAAQRIGTAASLAPPLTGGLPDGVQIVGHMDATGRYCLDGTSQSTGTSTFYITEEMDAAAEGDCLTSGWTPENANNTPDTPLPVAPDAPSLLSYNNLGGGNVEVTWEAVAGTTYLVSLSGQLTPAPITVGTTGVTAYTFTGVAPGQYTLTIRAEGPTTWGAPAVKTVYVNDF